MSQNSNSTPEQSGPAGGSADLIDVEVWTTLDAEAYNHGHELLIPGNVTEDDWDHAAEFFGCAREALKHEPRKVTEAELDAAAEAGDHI